METIKLQTLCQWMHYKMARTCTKIQLFAIIWKTWNSPIYPRSIEYDWYIDGKIQTHRERVVEVRR